MTWAASLAPLRAPNFRWYYASRFVNALGGAMANVALAFAVLDISGSATDLGLVLAAHTVPMVALLLYGGVLSDRLPRVLVIQVSNVVSAVAQGTIAFLVISGTADLWMLIWLSVVHGAASAMSLPAIASVMPQLVPRDQLQPANALVSLSGNGLRVLGPALAALLVVTAGPGWALAVDAATWGIAALLLLPVRIPPRQATGVAPDTIAELREGWAFFRSITWLWVVVLAFGFLNAIYSGAVLTLGPVVAQDTVGRQAWGYALSAEAAGLLLMTVIMLRVRLERPLLVGMLGIAVIGVPILMLGADPKPVPLVIAFFVAGMGTELFSLGWLLAMQENIDESMLSRAFSYDALGSFIAMPLGQLMFGPLGDAFGLQRVLVISGVVYVLIALLTLLSRSVRTLERVSVQSAS